MPILAQDDEIAFISGVSADGTLPIKAFYSWNGAMPASYTNAYTDSRKWGADTAGTGATVSYYLDTRAGWTDAETQAFTAGLALWSTVANITFTAMSAGDGANITILRGTDGAAMTITSATDKSGAGGRPGGTHLLTLTGATTSISTSVAGFGPIDGTFSAGGGRPLMTLLHEEGHALGLGHAGPYDRSVIPGTQQNGAYDNQLWSIMSYISPGDHSAAYYGQDGVTGANWNGEVPTTWMPLDILAIQRLYGVAVNTPLSGGQTFGFNSNITGATAPFFDFTKNTNPVVTLWDKGTGNTLDLSGFGSSSTVNLSPGTFSSVDGMANNIAIAYSTAIDTLVLGNGNNIVICNDDGNTVTGGSSNDTITGGAGNDTLKGGAGNNVLVGGIGQDVALFDGPRSAYTISSAATGVTAVVGPNCNNTVSQIELLRFSDISVDIDSAMPSWGDETRRVTVLLQGPAAQPAIWYLNGDTLLYGTTVGSAQGLGWTMSAYADFNGDGKSDILWQTPDHQAAIWMMDGNNLLYGAFLTRNAWPNCNLLGAADFNGNDKADILWQAPDGTVAAWIMNETNLAYGTAIGSTGGGGWKYMGTGDFDGNGTPDILWQTPGHQAAIWFMDGAKLAYGALVSSQVPSDWNIVGTADFDGDSKPDILWQRPDGQLALWMMDGTQLHYGQWLGNPVGSDWKIAAITPAVNGTADHDIVWQNQNGKVAVWAMSGSSLIGSAMISPAQATSWHVVAGTAT